MGPELDARPRETFYRWGCVALSALLVALSFPNPFALTLHPWGAPLAWVALVPFFYVLEGLPPLKAARWGMLLGFLMFGAVLYWIALLKEAQNLRVWGWLALAFILSLYIALFGFLQRFLRVGTGLFSSVATAALWTAVEYFRGSWPFGGFPWGQIGYAHAVSPSLLFWTTFTGIWGLTFLTVFVSCEIASSVKAAQAGRKREACRRSGWAVGLVLALYAVGSLCMWQPQAASRALRVACLQPNVDQSMKWSKANEDGTYRILEGLTRSAVPLKPSLILWPETASPNFLLWNLPALERVTKMVRDSRTPTLVGCLDAVKVQGKGVQQFNSADAFSASGSLCGTFHKMHLVPFGEYVPFQKYLLFLGPVVGDLGNFNSGVTHRSFDAENFTYTPLICYEAIFPKEVRSASLTGADLLVNISNDAWYGRTAALYQHALLCATQAASVRRPMVRAANTGISFLADASGRITASSTWWKEEVLVGEVPSASGATLYQRWGDWFPVFCWIMVLGLWIRAAWLGRFNRS
jgi:apolipoprotein N-acyltransferase